MYAILPQMLWHIFLKNKDILSAMIKSRIFIILVSICCLYENFTNSP